MKKTIKWNEQGFSLVELLAVIVILGIIASIGLVSIDSVIAKSKDKTFVNNALAIIHAAELAIKDEEVVNNLIIDNKITYKVLYDLNYINQFYDPYTGNLLSPSDNNTYVELSDGKISSVCLYGERHNLCSPEIGNLSVSLIKLNKN